MDAIKGFQDVFENRVNRACESWRHVKVVKRTMRQEY
jgi:hypothetical protein